MSNGLYGGHGERGGISFFLIDMSFLCYHWCTQGSKGRALRKIGMCGDRREDLRYFTMFHNIYSCLCRYF